MSFEVVVSVGGERGGGFPAWATEPVRIVDHDPGWADRATELAREVRHLFAGWLADDVLHVGSTAVPGLRAKPVIDLQAVADDPAAAVSAVAEAAAGIGWMVVPRELDRRPWRWLLVRTDAARRSRLAHLHLMPPGQDRWHDQLLFRDRLRSSPALRAEYALIKDRAAAEHSGDREAYGAAKTDFVRRATATGRPDPSPADRTTARTRGTTVADRKRDEP